mmetsp:Transcript_6801/g.6626  ORF Transcript_6801/g.6626 Transcript_6801/m.6626 type:complete len:80 (-) Transcript_6801:108-347(-)
MIHSFVVPEKKKTETQDEESSSTFLYMCDCLACVSYCVCACTTNQVQLIVWRRRRNYVLSTWEGSSSYAVKQYSMSDRE